MRSRHAVFFFFLQAEDGIRYVAVTGVQTCALPIFVVPRDGHPRPHHAETARRDRVVSAWMPVAWSNDAGGMTLGLRERSNYLGAYDRGLLFGTVATRPDATARFGGYLRFADPIDHLTPRTPTTVAAWAS